MRTTKNLTLVSLAVAGLTAMASGNALAGSMTVDSDGGLEVFEPNDNNYWFKIGGRLHIDSAVYEGNETERGLFPNGSHLRRARLSFQGGVGNHWVYKVDVDHLDRPNNPGRAQFGQAFMAYNGYKNMWIAIGQVGMPFSLAGWSSANSTALMELPLPVQAFAPDLGIGLYTEWKTDTVTLAGTIYQPKAGTAHPGTDRDSNFLPGSQPVSLGGRATFAPIHDEYTVYHAGLSYRYQNLNQNANKLNFQTGTDVVSRQGPMLYTNIPENSAKSFQVLGLEAAGRWGPLMLSGEYIYNKVNRPATFPTINDPRQPGGDLKYDGYYVAASYVLTGEAKDYDFASGVFGRVRPQSPKGAWEVNVRHSYVRLVDMTEFKALTPAKHAKANDMVSNAHSTALGVTWWLNNNVRFLANYARGSAGDKVNVNMFGLRAQVNW
jgi:phosphate-selective porin OprO/OprP